MLEKNAFLGHMVTHALHVHGYYVLTKFMIENPNSDGAKFLQTI